MKKLFLIITLVFLASVASAQYKEKYKDYSQCTECFDKWKTPKTGLENYGIPSPSRTNKNSFARQQLRGFGAIVAGIFVTAITYSIYNKVNQTANGIR